MALASVGTATSCFCVCFSEATTGCPNRSNSSLDEHMTARAAQYTWSGSDTSCAARANWIDRSVPPPSATATDAISATGAHQPLDALLADQLLVLAVLEHRAERAVGGVGVETLGAEQLQRRHPVDRLGDA